MILTRFMLAVFVSRLVAFVASQAKRTTHLGIGLFGLFGLVAPNALALAPGAFFNKPGVFGPSFGAEASDADPLFWNVASRRYFNDFGHVLSRFHENVEAQTDVLYLINTMNPRGPFRLAQNAAEVETWALGETQLRSHSLGQFVLHIPPQHMLMLKKANSNLPLFERDRNGGIRGLHSNAQVFALPLRSGLQGSQMRGEDVRVAAINYSVDPLAVSANSAFSGQVNPWIPVSTGRQGSGIRSFSGIFKVNERRTIEKRFSNNTEADPMQNSVYILAHYDRPEEGEMREAFVAIHGTPERNWHLLGRERSSAGCVRVQTDFSRWNRELLFDWSVPPTQRPNGTWRFQGNLNPKPELTQNIRTWNPALHYPPAKESFGQLPTSPSPRLKVKVVFFNGYRQNP